MLRTHPERDFTRRARRRRDREPRFTDNYRVAAAGNSRPDQIHRRLADKPRDELAGGALINLPGRAGLFDPSRAHHREPVRERQRFELVVGDIYERAAGAPLERLELAAQRTAQTCVEIRERFVEQHDARLANQCSCQRDALALAAGKLAGTAVQVDPEPGKLGGRRDATRDLFARDAPQPQRKRDIFEC